MKFFCVNWVGYLEVGILEGLSRNIVCGIVIFIRVNGFNCVRLIYFMWFWINDFYGELIVV